MQQSNSLKSYRKPGNQGRIKQLQYLVQSLKQQLEQRERTLTDFYQNKIAAIHEHYSRLIQQIKRSVAPDFETGQSEVSQGRVLVAQQGDSYRTGATQLHHSDEYSRMEIKELLAKSVCISALNEPNQREKIIYDCFVLDLTHQKIIKGKPNRECQYQVLFQLMGSSLDKTTDQSIFAIVLKQPEEQIVSNFYRKANTAGLEYFLIKEVECRQQRIVLGLVLKAPFLVFGQAVLQSIKLQPIEAKLVQTCTQFAQRCDLLYGQHRMELAFQLDIIFASTQPPLILGIPSYKNMGRLVCQWDYNDPDLTYSYGAGFVNPYVLGAIGLLLQTKVFLVGSNRSAMSRMCLSLINLISPFKYPHPVILAGYQPPFAAYFDAPMPLLGCFWGNQVSRSRSSDSIVIDHENCRVHCGATRDELNLAKAACQELGKVKGALEDVGRLLATAFRGQTGDGWRKRLFLGLKETQIYQYNMEKYNL